MLLLETHMHNCEVSPCAKAKALEIPSVYKEAGFDALAVTNHFSAYAFSLIEGNTSLEKVKNFLRLSELLVDEAKKQGLRAFLCMEVTLSRYQWQDYLVFGDIIQGIIDNPDLYMFTQEHLFELAIKYGWAVFQAHPFRTGCSFGIPKYMHGIEVYNGIHNSKAVFDRSVNFATKNNLKMSAGSDFHALGDEATAGIYIPEDIDNEQSLGQFLINSQPELYTFNKY